jgi:N-acetylglucosamine kinase-like BadF-type ATPase
MAGDLILGVEGGGTKTLALVADLQGHVLARGLAPSSSHRRVGFEKACLALATAIEGALSQVPGGRPARGHWGDRIAAACFGLSGVDQPSDQAMFQDWLKRQGLEPSVVDILNGSELILVGGTPEGWGVGLFSGTGSVCLGRTRDGRTARVGGWGPLLGDEGSGYQMALQALQVATQAADGRGSAQALLQVVLRQWRLERPQQLIDYIHRPEMTAAEIADLAIPIVELAGRADPDARKIMNHAAEALARHVNTVIRQLELVQPPLALGGANLRGELRTALMARVAGPVGPISVVPEPAQAALTIARRRLR